MRIGTYCLVAMVLIGMAGCMPATSVRPLDSALTRIACPNDQCEPIEVVIIESGTEANPQCMIQSVSIPGASMVGLPSGEKTLTWVLRDPDNRYEFSRDEWKYGILIKDDGADPTGKFKQVNIPGNGKRLTIRFVKGASSDANGYSYGLTVRRSSNMKFCTSLDPWLVG